MTQERDVFAPVLTALTADPSTEFGEPGARIEALRTIHGPFSSVQRVRIRTPSRTTHAYVKVLRPREPGGEELARIDRMLEREYGATRALYEALHQDAALGALRPIAILPEHRALVTEEVPGRPWGEVLAGVAALTEQQTDIARRVGAWVRIYQSIGGTAGVVEIAERRSYLDDRLRLIEGRVISPAERRAVLRQFDALAVQIGTSTVPAVAIHADLTPMNIIVGEDGRVTVLDFTMAKTSTAFHDLSHVFFHLEMMASRHRARRALFRALQRAMLNGYDTTLSAGHPLFRMMLMQQGVCHVALLAERRLPFVDVAYRWFLKRRWDVCHRMSADDPELRVA